MRYFLFRLPLISSFYGHFALGQPGQGFILTGAPGAGKTAIAIALEMRGEHVVSEAAVDFIGYHRAKGVTEPVLLPDCQEQITRLQLLRESRAPRSKRFFMDRSVLDGAAYMMLRGYSRSDLAYQLISSANVRRYNRRVFLIQSASQVRGPGERRGVIEPSLDIENAIRSLYGFLGFELIEVPFAPVDDRVDFILSKIRDAHEPIEVEFIRASLKNRDYLRLPCKTNLRNSNDEKN